jgi:hypothetical protein
VISYKNGFVTALALALLWIGTASAQSKSPSDGAARERAGVLEVFDAQTQRWGTPEQFWLSFAARNGGLTFGRGRDYPPYAQVKEFDTFLVETTHGPCLMQFFHQRWRRANDVQRWNDRFNDYAGCAHVFD